MKKFKRITLEHVFVGDLNYYKIVFTDENGYSCLARTFNEKYARKLVERFKNYIKVGRLLPIYKSAYKI